MIIILILLGIGAFWGIALLPNTAETPPANSNVDPGHAHH